MSKKPLLSRKSKRVAKRQEDEIYWLMHNFPQGIEYSDLCENAAVNSHTSPTSSKTRDLLTSGNDVFSDESTAKVAMKMPRVLRSGKSIVLDKSSPSDGEHSSCGDADEEEEENKAVDEKSQSEAVDDCTDSNKSPKLDLKEKNVDTHEAEKLDEMEKSDDDTQDCKSTPTESDSTSVTRRIITRSARSRSDVGIIEMAELPPKVRKRQSAPVLRKSSSSESEDSEAESLTPEEKIQLEKVELLKQPKFKAGPGKLCTRSGATYEFSWKSSKRSGRKAKTIQEKLDQVEAIKQMITRSGRTRQEYTTPKEDVPSVPLIPGLENVTIKVEQEDADSDIISPSKSFKKIKVGPPNPDYSAFMFPGSNNSIGFTAPRPKSLNLPAKRKRKRLSLLPTQNNEDYDFSATWLDALNMNQSPNSSKDSPACSRSESPVSPVSSVSSDQIAVPAKRRGRTASLNCRAVLSALIKPEPSRKALRKSPPKFVSSPKTKQVKVEGEPENFFKIQVTPSFSQKVEYVNNGLSSKIVDSPNSLKAHEARILAGVDKVSVKTNGWTWKGTQVWCCSFFRETSIKTTRLYFGAMERDGVELRVGDSVALQASDQDKKPFIGKIIAMWQENLGEMMVTLCWFYRPSDLENIKSPYGSHELYLSKHTDDNSAATIQNKVYVLSFPEYCRFYAHQAQTERNISQCKVVPNVIKWRDQVIPSAVAPCDSIYFCRGVYDFRLKRTLKQQLYYTKYL